VTTTAPAPEQPPEDGELLAKAAAGEREVFVAIYRRYHGGIYRFARSMTGSTAIAEDGRAIEQRTPRAVDLARPSVVEPVLFLAAQSQDAHGDERAACQQEDSNLKIHSGRT